MSLSREAVPVPFFVFACRTRSHFDSNRPFHWLLCMIALYPTSLHSNASYYVVVKPNGLPDTPFTSSVLMIKFCHGVWGDPDRSKGYLLPLKGCRSSLFPDYTMVRAPLARRFSSKEGKGHVHSPDCTPGQLAAAQERRQVRKRWHNMAKQVQGSARSSRDPTTSLECA